YPAGQSVACGRCGQGLRRRRYAGLRLHRTRGGPQGAGRTGAGRMSSIEHGTAHELRLAGEVLAALRAAFDTGVRALAGLCAPDGQLDAGELDRRQIESFETAWAGAELLAAETAIAAAESTTASLQAGLALVFMVEV